MQAVTQHAYGSPEVLALSEVERPAVGRCGIRVRVHAASVHRGDSHLMRGEPYVLRAGTGLARPKHRIPGIDVAGTVESVGRGVGRLGPGDEVFGWCRGALAEYVSGDENAFAAKPGHLSFGQAASIPTSAFAALQGLRDVGRIRPGHRALIVGASGGVGTFAVQIAKVLGAHVTGVCSAAKSDLVRSIGADDVLDYARVDFTRTGQRYDVILDMIGDRPLGRCRRALTSTGTYVLVGGPSGRWLRGLDRPLRALALSPLARRRLRPLISRESVDDLRLLADLARRGELTPVIDRTYPLGEVRRAMRYLEQGHAQGKVVIEV